MKRRSSDITIGLVWHSINSGNLGVGALTISNILIAEKIAKNLGLTPKFTIIGWSDPLPPYYDSDDIEVRRLKMLDFVKPMGGLYDAIRRCDVVLDISAGDSFSDIYGSKRVATQLATKVFTIFARRPLILCPQTIGPFNQRRWRRPARWVIERAAGVATRDTQSTAYVRDMGFRGEIVEATDVAMRLPYAEQKVDVRSGVVRIGINVSGLLFFGGYSRNNMFGLAADYPNLIRRLVAHFNAIPRTQVHLIGHVIPDHEMNYDGCSSDPEDETFLDIENDVRACHVIARDFPEVKLASTFEGPSSAKSYIASMDFFMGARMHACIAAFSAGVPVIPMAYSRKFEGLFGTLGYNRTVDCIHDDEDSIVNAILRGFNQREDLRSEMVSAKSNCENRLEDYENLLSRVFRGLA